MTTETAADRRRNPRACSLKGSLARSLLVMGLSVAGMVGPAAAQTPAQVGEWEGPLPWPIVSIHMMLLPTGQVLTFDGPPEDGGLSARLWNPATGQFSPAPNGFSNLVCVGQSFLADGRAFLAGGHIAPGVGLTDGNIFDPISRTWTATAPMSFPRWYPTVTTLGDGRMLVTSGSDTSEASLVPIPEIYDPRTNTWTQLTTASLTLPMYPHMFMLPNGKVLEAGAVLQSIPTRTLDLASQTWTVVDPNVVDGHSAVMYRPGKIMKSGTA